MNESEIVRYYEERDRFQSLSFNVDIINALYVLSQSGSQKRLMLDLCNALDVDGYYNLIDDAFKLTSFESPLSVYHLRVKLMLGRISTYASTDWETAVEWATRVHMRSTNGYEFFRLQQFREKITNVTLLPEDGESLIAELQGRSFVGDQYFMSFVHGQLGLMPAYFSSRTKQLYAKEIAAAVKRTNAHIKNTRVP